MGNPETSIIIVNKVIISLFQKAMKCCHEFLVFVIETSLRGENTEEGEVQEQTPEIPGE